MVYHSQSSYLPRYLSLPPLLTPPPPLCLCIYMFISAQRYSLQYAVTGIGKCRAWIRMAVNESSLESYIGVICQDSSLKRLASPY